jgi:hypothetical protein
LASLSHNASNEAKEANLDPDKIADRIEAAGMSGLAIVLLHAFKPLAWMGGQFAWMLQPFTDGPAPEKRSHLSMAGLANLLESERALDDLLGWITKSQNQKSKTTRY